MNTKQRRERERAREEKNKPSPEMVSHSKNYEKIKEIRIDEEENHHEAHYL
jgi:hypothetical protein